MELDFINQGPAKYNKYERIFTKLVNNIFEYFGIKTNYIIDVNIVDNKSIHEINKEYRGIDKATDVISFAFFDDKDEKVISDVPTSLGQILISYEKAEEQAEAYKHSIEREMSFLFTHGMLHLLGFDHMNKKDELIMFNIQDEILGGHFMTKEELIAKAIEARNLSYSPYSNFKVGAALLTKDGKVYLGSNIENSSYPLCMCAERNAMYNAKMHGMEQDKIEALAVVADTDEPCSPCGACRQVMAEILPKTCKVYLANLKGMVKETTIDELLPFAFSDKDLK